MRSIIDAKHLLQETRPDLPAWVVNRLARSAPHAVESKLAAFDLGCSVLRQRKPEAPTTEIFQDALNRPADTAEIVDAFLNGDEFDDLDSVEADRLMGLMEQARTSAPAAATSRAPIPDGRA